MEPNPRWLVTKADQTKITIRALKEPPGCMNWNLACGMYEHAVLNEYSVRKLYKILKGIWTLPPLRKLEWGPAPRKLTGGNFQLRAPRKLNTGWWYCSLVSMNTKADFNPISKRFVSLTLQPLGHIPTETFKDNWTKKSYLRIVTRNCKSLSTHCK